MTSTNNIVARNFDGVGAGGGSILKISNDTVYSNGNEGVFSSGDSTATVMNTIIVNHKEGLNGDVGSFSSNYNLLKNDDN